MKSEHRHELKENELGKLTVQAQSFLKAHSNQILLAMAALIVILVSVTLWMRMSSASSSMGWTLYEKADSAEAFATIADKLPKTEVGQWSRLNESENYLSTGLQNAFKDRKSAESDLKRAQAGFEGVLNSSPLPPELHERALYGLARTLETTTGRDTSKAVEVYSKFVQTFPNSVYKPLAESRMEDLKKGGTQEFYAWFQEQSPSPEDRSKPKDGLPANHPPIGSKASGEKPAEEKDPATPEVPSEKPATEKPADPASEKPEGSKPSNESPEKPSDTTKPDEAKPPESKPKTDSKPESKEDPKAVPKSDATPDDGDPKKPE